jgi:spore coat protein E
MFRSKTILTKTIIGQGFKKSTHKHLLEPNHLPDSILGCWIINHNCKCENKGEYTEIQGSYEIHLWYSYENRTLTEVITQTFLYCEEVEVSIFNELDRRAETESFVQVVEEPFCLQSGIEEAIITIDVEAFFLVKEAAELYLKIDTYAKELADFIEENGTEEAELFQLDETALQFLPEE